MKHQEYMEHALMQLYNTLTHKKETFAPTADYVTMYVCGITPYDTTHLGHAFTYIVFDTLARYFQFKGWPVDYAQNVTDIDDDILRQANQVNQDWKALGARWTRRFIEDMDSLNVLRPTYYPRATEEIPRIIEMTQVLIDKNFAYEKNGGVYFHVDSCSRFGQLSRIPRDEMLPIANERGNIPDDLNKRDPLDFVLWQAAKPDEPSWDSPWGLGRPGWHIECSAMSLHYLGQTIDIHGGGSDLVFPHHECEIAQSEQYTGAQPFVRFWIHIAMVRHEGEKMSKSLGNLVMVRDLLQVYGADAIRAYLLSHHYRTSWEYDEAKLKQAATRVKRYATASYVDAVAGSNALDGMAYRDRFAAAMDDDLNTPVALSVLDELVDAVLAATGKQDLVAAQGILRELTGAMGLRLEP
jgi:L-cysteine:1D-myo-inositol 2-amino-2-deoxy-alpha-D-glucopyranoside ligase